MLPQHVQSGCSCQLIRLCSGSLARTTPRSAIKKRVASCILMQSHTRLIKGIFVTFVRLVALALGKLVTAIRHVPSRQAAGNCLCPPSDRDGRLGGWEAGRLCIAVTGRLIGGQSYISTSITKQLTLHKKRALRGLSLSPGYIWQHPSYLLKNHTVRTYRNLRPLSCMSFETLSLEGDGISRKLAWWINRPLQTNSCMNTS